MHAKSLQSCLTLWTVALQALLSMEFARQEYWSGLPCPLPGDLANSGIKSTSSAFPALQEDSLPLSYQGSPYYYLVCVFVPSLQICLTLCDPMDCNSPGSSVHGILQARILEWVAMPSSRASSPPRDRTHISGVSGIGTQIL